MIFIQKIEIKCVFIAQNIFKDQLKEIIENPIIKSNAR